MVLMPPVVFLSEKGGGGGYSEVSRVPDYFKLSTILTNFECNDLKNKLGDERYVEFHFYSLKGY